MKAAPLVVLGITLLSGCTSESVPLPGGTPASTPTPIPLSLSPSMLSFGAASGPTQTVAITDGNAGPYAASGCSGIVTATVSGTTVTVTALAAGSCTLTVSDPAANKATVSLNVTTVSLPIQ